MKKFFGLYDREEEQLLKNKIISFTGIPSKYVNFLEIYVNTDEFVHVTLIDDISIEDKRDLVLIHGLAGSSLNYFKMFKRLSRYFRIYAVDLPGMGCSSRHHFHHPTVQEVEDYFLDRLKCCFDKLSLDNFILCGHSFGGYISSLFTIRFSHMIEQLILLSPVGLSSNYSEIVSTRLEDMLQTMAFRIKKPPTLMFKILGGMISNIIFNYVCSETKFKGLKNEEFEVNRNFLNVLFRNKTGSERAVFAFFNKNLQAYKPITYYYEFLKNKKILVLYGGDDWCPKRHAEDLQSLLSDNLEIDIVSESGHLLFTDNYEELTDKLLAFTLNIKPVNLKNSEKSDSQTPSTVSETPIGELNFLRNDNMVSSRLLSDKNTKDE